MLRLKQDLLAGAAVTALFLGGTIGTASGAFAAEAGPAAGSSGVAGVACSPEAGNWTDCGITLSQPVNAGGEVAVTAPSNSGAVEFCDDNALYGGEQPDLGCSVTGNTAIFDCEFGCPAGTELSESVLGDSTSATSLAQSMSVTAGTPPAPTSGS